MPTRPLLANSGRSSRSWLPRRTEHRHHHRLAVADIEALDALGECVTQSERIGALHEAALAARIDQREMARARAQEFGGAAAANGHAMMPRSRPMAMKPKATATVMSAGKMNQPTVPRTIQRALERAPFSRMPAIRMAMAG